MRRILTKLHSNLSEGSLLKMNQSEFHENKKFKTSSV